MCLFATYIRNKRYLPNKKNNGYPVKCKDERTRWVAAKCGVCPECRKEAANQWRIRLIEDFKQGGEKKFVTLSFSPESLKKLMEETGLEECNAIAIIAMRRFLERWRRKYKKSVKHWAVTELGGKNSERIHLHAILWTDKTKEEISERWKYGNVDVGYKCDQSTVTYISKYLKKEDKKHIGYKPRTLVSPGIGKNYIDEGGKHNVYRGERTFTRYKERNGTETALPTYYKNHIYTASQREALWIMALNRHEAYKDGYRYNLLDEHEERLYFEKCEELRMKAVKENKHPSAYKDKTYNITERMLLNYRDLMQKKDNRPIMQKAVDYSMIANSSNYALGAQSFESLVRKPTDKYDAFFNFGIMTINITKKEKNHEKFAFQENAIYLQKKYKDELVCKPPTENILARTNILFQKEVENRNKNLHPHGPTG